MAQRGARFVALLSVVCASIAPAAVQSPMAGDDPDSATITVPSLAFAPDPTIEKDFDKYYYFQRDGTDFKTALADLRDCDGLARGLSAPYGYAQAPYPNTYTLAGVAGAAIANAMVAAIFLPALLRANRRINMRRCMNYKGYQRYGLTKAIWESFNFEEGLGKVSEPKRQVYLMQQAKIASGPKPATQALGR